MCARRSCKSWFIGGGLRRKGPVDSPAFGIRARMGQAIGGCRIEREWLVIALGRL
jgi:hypothetical protein